MTDINLLKICNYIIENHATFEETSFHFGCSIETIRYYIKKLKSISEENIEYSDINWKKILNKIEEIKQENQIIGKSKGRKIGKRKSKWTDEDIKLIAQTIISNGWTLRDAEEKLGQVLGDRYSKISKSTIHELLYKIKDPELQSEILLKFYETIHNPEIAQKRS